ncbi:MAG: glycosyltransferase family 39 protein [Myxococcales bacterium]|nr:glycosyltransferase family 39 protein [Myxococcales bacterium]
MILGALRTPTWFDHGIGLLLCLLQVGLLVLTNDQVGIPRDESFYFAAADRAADWWLADHPVVQREGRLAEPAIRHGFEYNHEHPVGMKSLFGVSHRLLNQKWGWVKDHMLAYRLPTMALAGLATWLAFLLGLAVQGRAVGLFAALALMAMPRVFFHSHLACFDAPVTFAWLAIAYSYLRAGRSRRWGVVAGLALGVGFTIKLNAFFVPFVLLIVAAIDAWQFKRRTGGWRAPAGERGPLTYHAWTAASMLVLGPAVFFAHWPWLWFETGKHLSFYLSFHAKHVHYPVDYLGTLYYRPPFPMHFPFVFTAFSVPVGLLVLGAVGLGVTLKRAWRAFTGAEPTDRHAADVFLLGNLLAPMVVIALPFTPIFGGTKHWMPSMPFLAVLAGLGLLRAAEGLRPAASKTGQGAMAAVLALLALVPAFWATLHAGPHGPAYYNALAGGPPGAAALRMPRNFWGYSTIEALPWLNAHTEQGAMAFWHNATAGAIRAYQRDGRLRADVAYTGDWTVPYSDWAVYCDAREKLPEELDIWRDYGTQWPVEGVFLDGVQLIGTYHREGRAAPPVPAGAR